MLQVGFTLDTIVRELNRRWTIRPRLAYRYVHGWSQDEVAARLTAAAFGRTAPWSVGAEPDPSFDAADPGLHLIGSGARIGEYERWPTRGRQPSIRVLVALAEVFGTTVDQLIDYEDFRALTPVDRSNVLHTGGG